MDNQRGSGIFLGIVSIATLIVAIIGATFAYFSASTESSPNAIGATAYEFKLSLSVTPVYPIGATALIPLNPTTVIPNAPEKNNTNLLFALNEAATKCVDDSGLQVCALYKVTINNQAGNEVTLSGKLTTTSNEASTEEGRTPFANLTYQAVKGSHEDNSFTLSGEPVKISSEVNGEIPIANVTVSGAKTVDGRLVPGEGITYVLVYLNDNGDQSSEMGASFTGMLTYTSADGLGNTLTGSFQVAAPEPEEPNTGEDETEEPTDDPTDG